MVKSDGPTRKAKHMDLRYHFIHDRVQQSTMLPPDSSMDENAADMFTKPLDRVKFEKFRSKIGVREMM